ncbi:MAG: molybdopterin cofactor-binding domain-containing protein [Betaproteobacteria bacterium]
MTIQITDSIEITSLPPFVASQPKLSQWMAITLPGKITIYSGKVELGQGISIALSQIVCEELGIRLDQLDWVAGNTYVSPNEWYTAGSLSVENGGAALRCSCTYARWLFLQQASKVLNVDFESITISDGIFTSPSTSEKIDYWVLAKQVNLENPIQIIHEAFQIRNKVIASGLVGQSSQRPDLLAKLSGAAFIQDMVLPEMRHARMLRASHPQSTIVNIDVQGIEQISGVERLVRSGNFLAIVGKNEALLVKAVEKAHELITWQVPTKVIAQQPIDSLLKSMPAVTEVSYEAGHAEVAQQSLRASYTRPFLAHASIGPACALAQLTDGHLTVWSHTQGSHLLRDQIAQALRVETTKVDVIHAHGAGCYGHNSADDVAFDAAMISHVTGFAIRLQWSREEELTASPFGAPSITEIQAGLDASGDLVQWNMAIWSPTHIARPGWGTGINLLGAWAIEPAHPEAATKDNPMPQGGGLRNSVALYEFPHQQITHHFLPSVPLRTSALRSLGAYANIFAIESFLDEIAEKIGADPVEYRLRYLKNERARDVLIEVANMAKWSERSKLPEGSGLGIAFAQYKNHGAYCAVAVQIRVEEKIHIEKVWSAVDAGLVINPDGLLNQTEGGIIQALSWTLKEEVSWNSEEIVSHNWDSYPILMFDEVPELEVKLLSRPDQPSLGGGESAAGPTVAAVANALSQALGIRARDLPFTPEKLAQLIG